MTQPKHAEPQVVAEVVNKFGDPEAFAERELRVLGDIQKLPIGTKLVAALAHPDTPCGVCFESQAFTGTCGGGRDNPKALCFQGTRPTSGQAEGPTDAEIDKLARDMERRLEDYEPAPVAWRYRHSSMVDWEYTGSNVVADQARRYTVEPLYALSPVDRSQPVGGALTDEDLRAEAALKWHDSKPFIAGARYAQSKIAASAPALQAGWVAVPREPTEAMLDAACEVDAREQVERANLRKFPSLMPHSSAGDVWRVQYKAAIAAAPSQAGAKNLSTKVSASWAGLPRDDDASQAGAGAWPHEFSTRIAVSYSPDDWDTFIYGVSGHLTMEAMAEIDKQLRDEDAESLFDKGPGDYLLSASYFKGQYSVEGRCEIAPGWELSFEGFRALSGSAQSKEGS